ncbi:hypothetical protein PUV54_07185 [Hyphococcus flavus]|uniref:Uncharacterized protein n=1 Tax=Hyphococcus flavus TaxID=1866326 RepID=A0AAE9ZDH8_9PROT|nr:hypothetical protein [Hyphococcus flavus]WDI32979.1 hypothetical protein PUV54_07185 [Hyphococcus flavus]
MTNRTFYASVLAFAAAATMHNGAQAQEAQFDSASLMQKINADLDARNQNFTLAVVNQADANVQSRMAKIENVFAPLTEPSSYDFAATAENTKMNVEFAALEKAEFEVSKKVANIEDPFQPRLPMPPVMIAFDNEGY